MRDFRWFIRKRDKNLNEFPQNMVKKKNERILHVNPNPAVFGIFIVFFVEINCSKIGFPFRSGGAGPFSVLCRHVA